MTSALITGASYGIGREIARALAARGHDLVLVARTASALDGLVHDLEAEYAITATILPADLTDPDQLASVAHAARFTDILVNNAGAGLGESFDSTSWSAEHTMLTLNVTAPTRLIHAALPEMLLRGKGRILTIGSVAGTGPVWLSSTYGPSKAFGLALTQSLTRSRRVRRSDVHLTHLVVGHAVSQFHSRAGIAPSPKALTLSTRVVAEAAVRALRGRRRVIYVPSVRYKILDFVLKHTPWLLTPIPGVCTDFTVEHARAQRAGAS